MRIHLVLAALALMSVSFLASPVAASGAVLNASCPDLGATTMAADHTAILLCAFPVASEATAAATNCGSPSGCVWKPMSGGGGGASFVYYCYTSAAFGWPLCTDHAGIQGHCPSVGEPMSGGLSGLKEKAYLGRWGTCTNLTYRGGIGYDFPLPPDGACNHEDQGSATTQVGNAYICSQ